MYQPTPRRTLLKTAGISLALPLLESTSPAIAATNELSPRRLVFICTTLGLHGPSFWPASAGADYEMTEYLGLLKNHRESITIFSGLSHQHQSGRRPHDSESTWLTASHNPGFPGFQNSVSVDQIMAQAIGDKTRFASLSLSSNTFVSQSYDERGVMIPARTRPAELFADLFLDGSAEEVARQKQRLADGQSLLDQMTEQLTRVRRSVSVTDSRLLDEYVQSIRAVERDLKKSEAWMMRPKPKIDIEPPKDVRDKRDLVGRVRSMMKLIPLILQTDSSRVITLMIQDHSVAPKIPGVSADHHNLSHHGNDPAKIAQLRLVETQLLSCFSDLLTEMTNKDEASGSLLNHTAILFGSNLGDANMHNTRNPPTILAGGSFAHGSFQKFDDPKPLSNLFLAMLDDA